MAAIRLNNVSKVYGKNVILHELTLDIIDREFLVLVGPSGCGKSTLLKLIAGLEELSGGEIFFGEKKIDHLSPGERDLAMVFQSYALYPHLTVSRNLSLTLELKKWRKEKIAEKVSQVAKILQIEDLLDRKPAQLSGGQRQRVAMGRALVRSPHAFLFDEPLSNLDAELRLRMRTEIKLLHQQFNTTTIYVTHDQIEAMTLADRVVVMKAGKIQQIDTPMNLYNRPANVFVASFMGSPAMNFLPIVDGVIKATSIPIPFAPALPHWLGIRPEHLTLSSTVKTALVATVLVVEPLGNEMLVNLQLGPYRLDYKGRFSAELRVGQEVFLSLLPESCHYFDCANEQRL